MPELHPMRMDWLDLCFMHWRVDAEALAATLPHGLTLDTFGGEAWIALVPFRMSGVAPRFLPDIPGQSAFAELNVRTYVVAGGVPGVWFYSLDAANPLAVRLARQFFHLPYLNARVWLSEQNGITRFASLRTHAGAPAGRFAAAYRPTGAVFHAQAGTLEHWLTHRLFLYSADQRGRIFRGEVAHAPWPLQPAQAVIRENTVLRQPGIRLLDDGAQPHLLYSKKLHVTASALTRVQ